MADKDADRQCYCKDTIVEVREKRQTRPQPWIVLKLTVGFTIAIVGYTTYVYVVRLCVPMIRGDSGAFGRRVVGIIFLVVFSILFAMFVWTYAKVIFTKPGFARDYVPMSEQPLIPVQRYRASLESAPSESRETRATPEQIPSADVPAPQPVVTPPQEARTAPTRQSRSKSVPKFPTSPKSSRSYTRHSSHGPRPEHKTMRSQTNTSKNVAQPVVTPPPPVLHVTKPERTPSSQGEANSDLALWNTRRPPTTPILLPEHRYCNRDGLVKPFRTHHCRACGTCILKYDHHCPWVGQCVGAQNQKYFVNFLQWSPPFCLWIFASTLALEVMSSNKQDVVFDPQIIVTIVLGGVFGLFTVMILFTQIRMVLLNRTTVESILAHSMKLREGIKLSRLHPWYNISAKRRTKKQWDEEWGEIDAEGNIWWLGSMRANWEDVMGRNPWWWFLPIGRSMSDGLTYERNARFDESGLWRRRKEWPAELQ